MRAALLVAFAAGVLLRLALALVNTQANDPHLPVIRIIAFEYRFPERLEAWEAFQPKLYHVTVALLWRLWPNGSPAFLNQVAQLTSCAAGIATLVIVFQFLRRLAIRPQTRLVIFSLVALSPPLIGVSAQATNDAFVILFATIALYSGHCFFRSGSRTAFGGLVLGSLFAGLSKGNGLVVIIAVVLTLGVALLRHAPGRVLTRRQVAGYGVAFLLVVLPLVWELGPYGDHQRRYGSPFVTNWDPPERAHLWRETRAERPGLTSLAHGLLTFRMVDVMRHPVSTDHHTVYPRHRTSLWTRLHAQAHSIHFEGFPYSWQARSLWVEHLGRALFIVGLLPSLLIAGTLAAAIAGGAHQLWRDRRGVASPETFLLVISVLGFVGFVVVYTVHLRDYGSMKLIFALPGLLGFALLAARGWEKLHAWGMGRRWGAFLGGIIVVLLAGYAADVLVLIRDLALDAR